MIFSNVFTIPGGMLQYLGRKNHKLHVQTEAISGIIKSYRKITEVELVAKLGTAASRAEFLLSRAVSFNLIKGNFDSTTGEFYTLDSIEDKAKINFCQSCGDLLGKAYLAGETIKCGACSMIF